MKVGNSEIVLDELEEAKKFYIWLNMKKNLPTFVSPTRSFDDKSPDKKKWTFFKKASTLPFFLLDIRSNTISSPQGPPQPSSPRRRSGEKEKQQEF